MAYTSVKAQEIARQQYELANLIRAGEEEQVLAMFFRNEHSRSALSAVLGEACFTQQRTMAMWLAMQRLEERSKPIDVVSCASESRVVANEKKFEVKLKPQDFGELLKIELPPDIEVTANMLKSTAEARALFDFFRWGIDGLQNYMEPETLVREAQNRLAGIIPQREDTRVHYGENMEAGIMASVKARREAFRRGESVYVDFPWASWNNSIGIHTPGKLLMIAMPDGSGKSTVGAQIAWHVAERMKRHAFVIALEDGIDSIEGRIAARIAGIPYNKFMIGDITDEQEEKLANGMKSYPHRLHFVTMPGASTDEVIREMQLQHLNGKLEVAIIDYLNAMVPSARNVKLYGGLYNSQKGDANDLVAFSTSRRVPIITLDQMNKGFMKLSAKEKKEQGRSNIFGGSGKFHAAQIVLLGENSGPPAEDAKYDMVKWYIDKSNNGKKQFEFAQQMQHGRYVLNDIGV